MVYCRLRGELPRGEIMRWIVSTLLSLFVFGVAVLSQPPPKGLDKKSADKMDKKSADKMDKKSADKMDKVSPTSSTESTTYNGETLKQWIEKLSSPDPSIRDSALPLI